MKNRKLSIHELAVVVLHIEVFQHNIRFWPANIYYNVINSAKTKEQKEALLLEHQSYFMNRGYTIKNYHQKYTRRILSDDEPEEIERFASFLSVFMELLDTKFNSIENAARKLHALCRDEGIAN